jgi:hypothetical protein
MRCSLSKGKQHLVVVLCNATLETYKMCLRSRSGTWRPSFLRPRRRAALVRGPTTLGTGNNGVAIRHSIWVHAATILTLDTYDHSSEAPGYKKLEAVDVL